MNVNKKDIDKWLFRGEETACKYCCYRDDCHRGAVCYGGEPIFPYCAENDDTDNIEYDDVLYDLEKDFKELFMELELSIKKVIFNKPATIVLWSNGDKTVVKCQDGDKFDKEKGLSLAVMKYVFGNKSKYNDVIKKHCGIEE
jgi:hypothetical protein